MRPPKIQPESKSFFFENIKVLLIIVIVVLIISAVSFYIFSRVSRYRTKYKENKYKIALLQQQKEEYEQMSTDVFGQTLGDNILGLVYESNPCYEQKEVDAQGKTLEEEIEIIQQKCKGVESKNKLLSDQIEVEQEKYNKLAEEVDALKKSS